MRKKCKLSKAILKTKSCNKYLKMKDTAEDIESKLKESYSSRRIEKRKISNSKDEKGHSILF